MPRTRTIVWLYECDAGQACTGWQQPSQLTVTKGDRQPTGRSLIVNDQSDADAVARRDRWTVGSKVTCPACALGGPDGR